MMDDVVGPSGHERHVEGVEHDAGLQIGREGPSDDPARTGVENDREERKPANVGRKLILFSNGSSGEALPSTLSGACVLCVLVRHLMG
jgi:hypothetical protein